MMHAEISADHRNNDEIDTPKIMIENGLTPIYINMQMRDELIFKKPNRKRQSIVL